MAPKIELASAAPDKVRADLLAVPVFTGPQARPAAPMSSTAALGGTLLVVRGGSRASRASAARRSRCRPAASSGAKAAVLVGMGDPDKIDADALRRAGAALARRSAKVAKVATTLLDAAPDSLDPADGRAGVRRRRRARRLPVPHLQVGRQAHEARPGCRCSAARTRRSATGSRVARASPRPSCGRATS